MLTGWHSQVDFLQASRTAAGGTDRVLSSEGVFELNYESR
jgi:hypothetical protein